MATKSKPWWESKALIMALLSILVGLVLLVSGYEGAGWALLLSGAQQGGIRLATDTKISTPKPPTVKLP